MIGQWKYKAIVVLIVLFGVGASAASYEFGGHRHRIYTCVPGSV